MMKNKFLQCIGIIAIPFLLILTGIMIIGYRWHEYTQVKNYKPCLCTE